MADIFVTIRATPHTSNDLLNIDVIPSATPPPGDDPSTVYLSTEDGDRIVWLGDASAGSITGTTTVSMAAGNNPFDPSASTGGAYQVGLGGSANSGVAVITPPNDNESFVEFKYSVEVHSNDNQRHNTIDPRIRIRRKSVYTVA